LLSHGRGVAFGPPPYLVRVSNKVLCRCAGRPARDVKGPDAVGGGWVGTHRGGKGPWADKAGPAHMEPGWPIGRGTRQVPTGPKRLAA
jgi:hypothetical protein